MQPTSSNAIQAAPIPTSFVLDRWHLAHVRFFAQMSLAAMEEWRRIAHPLSVTAGKPLEIPYGWGVGAVESGRLRFLVKGVPPEPEPPPVLIAPPPKGKTPPPPPPRVKPFHVATMTSGDLFGGMTMPDKTTLLRRNVEIEALRDSRVWLISDDVFRQFVWKHDKWRMPVPNAVRWSDIRASANTRRLAEELGRFADGMFPAQRLPLDGLWGRSMNARAAWLLIRLLQDGSELVVGGLRIRQPFSAGELAVRLGADAEWTRAWAQHCVHERILRRRGTRWLVLEQWRLHHWATYPTLEQAFELPGGAFSFEEPIEPAPVLGTPSKPGRQ